MEQVRLKKHNITGLEIPQRHIEKSFNLFFIEIPNKEVSTFSMIV